MHFIFCLEKLLMIKEKSGLTMNEVYALYLGRFIGFGYLCTFSVLMVNVTVNEF